MMQQQRGADYGRPPRQYAQQGGYRPPPGGERGGYNQAPPPQHAQQGSYRPPPGRPPPQYSRQPPHYTPLHQRGAAAPHHYVQAPRRHPPHQQNDNQALPQPRAPLHPPPPQRAPAVVPLGMSTSARPKEKEALPELDTAGLRAYLDDVAPLDDMAGARRRQLALSGLNDMFLAWVAQVWVEKGLPKERKHEAGGKIVISGSYRLGVVAPDGDIDTVCLCPSHCTMEDFFGTFVENLQANPLITQLNAIPSAKVPLVTFFYDTIDIDLIPVMMPLKTIESTLNISDVGVLRGVGESHVRPLNGPRDTARTIQIVDRRTAAAKRAGQGTPIMEPFKTCLRAMNHWRKQRKIDKNKFGYFGGINMQLMAAFVTKTLGHVESSATLLHRFFYIFQLQMAKGWGPDNPVYLTSPPPPPDFEVEGPWSWSAADVSRHRPTLMPLITPCFPTMDSLGSVNSATYRIIHDEMIRGEAQLNALFKATTRGGGTGMSAAEERGAWEALFEPVCFPACYNHFIQVTIEAGSDDQMRKWQGFVESRLRTFVGDLARLPFSRVRPWPKGIAVLPLLELPAPAVLAIPTPSASHAAAAAAAQAEDGAAEREVDEAVETTATLTKKKVKELQSMLAAEGLEKKGKKSVLVARLLEAQAVAAAKRIAAAAAASAVSKGEATSNVEEAGGANGAEAEAEKEKKTEVEEDGEDDVDSGNEGTAARERVSLKYIYLIGVEIDKQRLGKKPLNLSTKAAVWTNQILNHKLRSTDEDPELMLLSCQQVHFKNLSPIVMDEFGGAAVVNAARDARRRAKALAKRLKKEELVRLAREQLLQREVEAAEGEAGALKRAREEGSVGSSLTSSLAAGLSSLTRPLKREKWNDDAVGPHGDGLGDLLGAADGETELDPTYDSAMHRSSHMLGWGAWVPKAGADPQTNSGQPTGFGKAVAAEEGKPGAGGKQKRKIVVTLLADEAV